MKHASEQLVAHTVRDRGGAVLHNDTVAAHLPPFDAQLCSLDELRASRHLIIRRDAGLGDCVMVLPGLSAAKETVPGLQVTFECSAEYVGLLQSFDEVDRATPIELREGRGGGVLVDLSGYAERHPEAWTRDRSELFAGAFGVQTASRPPRYRAAVVDLRWADRWLRRALGADRRRVIGIALRGKYAHRSWPEHHVRTLARDLADAGAGVVIFDSSADASRRGWGRDTPALAYGLPLTKVAALLLMCSAVVAPDTGLMHLAGALGVPFVGIFGAVDPAIRTKHYRRHVSLLPHGLDCSPCCEGPRHHSCGAACMDAVTPAMVLDALAQLLRACGEHVKGVGP